MSILAGRAGVVCDLDGVVYLGPVAIPGAVAALAASELPIVYATNNAGRPPSEVSAHLRELGLPCTDEQVATSSQAAAWLLRRDWPGAERVLALGGPGVALALREAGLEPVTGSDAAVEDLDAVVQGYGKAVTAADLAEAAYAIHARAVWVATNTDATLPTDRGIAPGNGSLIHAVRMAVGRDPDAVAGKPHPPLYRLSAERLGVDPTELLAVGDRLDTDIEGAVTSGMPSVLVLTGVSGIRELLAAPAQRRPTWVIPDLTHLGDELPIPVCDGDLRCVVGDASALWQDTRWQTTGSGLPLVNAMVGAAHAWTDRWGTLPPSATTGVVDALRGATER